MPGCDRRLDFLRNPPGYRLVPLTGDRQRQHYMCINDQWRVCFFWARKDWPADVEIIDCCVSNDGGQ
ncbi:MAG: plasmid maintenance system killer protein [Proteobacteria bacterium]|nr:plasmid maintenance system killer protein [Pseudomonadota bacterium]MBS0495546.1 plasmid maintenance system killer protein [Pseudomonadota bacterium]